MKTESRKINSLRNTIVGVISQSVYLLMVFICRTILIKKLGVEILGISGLYSNILSILSLAELGIGNTLLFNLYKPLADNDQQKVTSLLRFYSKLYNGIALIVLIVGLTFLPFLQNVVSNDLALSTQDLYLYYLLFLANSCLSYIACHKQMLLLADQKNFIIKTSNTIFYILTYLTQIIFLLIIPDYRIYLIISCVFTLLQNITLNIFTNKLYPYIKQIKPQPLDKETRNDIKKNIGSTFLYKIGAVLQTSTDNILISTIVSTLAVGYYSNYNMIITALSGFLNIFIYAVYSSIGNLSTENNSEKSYHIFNCLLLIFQYICTFASVCLLTVFNDFITIWIGTEYLFDFPVVLVIVLLFYISNVPSPIWIYRENYGLFHNVKYFMLISATLNIILSIALGLLWGVFGILLATIIAKLLTTLTFEPFILFKRVFSQKPSKYFLKQLLALAIFSIIALILYELYINIPINMGNILLKIIINFVVTTFIYIIIYFKTKEFKFLYNIIKNLFTKKKKNRNKSTEA